MARFTEWCEELEEALAEPFPKEILKTKKTDKGKVELTYCPVWFYVRRLNHLVGVNGWSMGEPIMVPSGSKLAMAVSVTILGVTKVNVGDEDEDKDSYGTPATNAWAQGFKRTMSLFGMGLEQFYIYKGGPMPRREKKAAPTPSTKNAQQSREESDVLNERAIAVMDTAESLGQLRDGEKEKILTAIATGEHEHVRLAVDTLNHRIEKLRGNGQGERKTA